MKNAATLASLAVIALLATTAFTQSYRGETVRNRAPHVHNRAPRVKDHTPKPHHLLQPASFSVAQTA